MGRLLYRREAWFARDRWGAPVLDCSRLEEVREGLAWRMAFKRKPECLGKQKGNGNVFDLSRKQTPFRATSGPGAEEQQREREQDQKRRGS